MEAKSDSWTFWHQRKRLFFKTVKADNLESIADMTQGQKYIATQFSFAVCTNDSVSLRNNWIPFCIFCLCWQGGDWLLLERFMYTKGLALKPLLSFKNSFVQNHSFLDRLTEGWLTEKLLGCERSRCFLGVGVGGWGCGKWLSNNTPLEFKKWY